MEPIYLSIKQKETGNRIKYLLKQQGYTVRDVQEMMGFENPQAIYKWLSGRSLPSIDNFVILSKALHTTIEEILVIDGDFAMFTQLILAVKKRREYNYMAYLKQSHIYTMKYASR